MTVNLQASNPQALGMHQAKTFWHFLFERCKEDVQQEVALAVVEHPPAKDLRAFERAVNRNCYRLAKDLGYRQTPRNQGGKWKLRECRPLKEMQ